MASAISSTACAPSPAHDPSALYSLSGAAVRFEYTGTADPVFIAALFSVMSAFIFPEAGSIIGLWNALPTASGATRSFASLAFSLNLSTAAMLPETTVCVGALKFAAMSMSPFLVSSTISSTFSLSPIAAAIVPAAFPSSSRPASPIQRPRFSISSVPVFMSVIMPAAVIAEYSPRLKPAMA